ncbi:hypothetical protein Tco_0842670 [Tanacetum coccineum]|uniref:Retrovirus-related Pol polyprotein from transposon TNT 1-94-like beta-barrel domain-containing protein n=1 Tax=Tanacetum coccineum TaxID=301880 RepID=A0ABQ5B3T5_9ASTR
MSENEDRYHDYILDLEAKLKKNVDLILKLGNSLQGMFMLGPKPLSVYDQQLKHGLGYPNPYTLKQAISQCLKLYLASSLGNSEIFLNIRDTEDTLDDASKSQQKRDIKEIKDAFESIESELCELEKQTDFLKDRLLEVSLKHEVELSVLLIHECVDNSLHDEIEELKKKSIEIQEGLQARIKILEKDVQRCEKQRMNAASSVRRPMNRDSHVKNSVLANSKKPAKKVAVYVRKNKQTDIASENVISNKENVIDVDVANASKAKTLLCVSFHKTRFSKESTLSKSLDTTYVVSKPKIDVGSTSKANDKVVQIVLWIVDSGCSKHMTGDQSLLNNFIEKFMCTVRFGNDNFAAITGYGDYIQDGAHESTKEDLQGDALLHYDAEIKAMNLILLSIPNDIYNSVDACTTAKAMWKRVEREALVSVYNRFAPFMNNLERNDMHFPIVTVNTKVLNSLQPEWLKYVTQVHLAKRLTVDTFDDLFDYLQQFEKLVNASRAKKLEKSHDHLALVAHTGSSSRNTSSYYDEAGVILTDEQNDFLFADASRMEEIEELNANICLMARIQPADNTSDAGPSYDSAFISEVQSSSNTENEEQMYPTHTKIINSTIGDDQIDSDIIFDSPNGNVNSGSIEKDTHVPDLCALEQLARNAYQEAEKQQIFAQKVQKQNTTLTSQLELYKERVRVLENINGDNNYLNEFLEADKRAKHFSQQAQSQFVRDRDIIRDLEKQRDKLDLDVKDYKRQNEEL